MVVVWCKGNVIAYYAHVRDYIGIMQYNNIMRN
jgi:hypothetical protein